ncbi:hypothetical protein OH76DRAFT_1478705 [Lentinus brumalis]|uniref:Uncharacterized protein n=1 Tax=Lentinus brumalis TaxID=2498619 RepID=A0A371DRX7_9APHY|nr:hypothetical protein OH76DRAFT_1478705 [Polyporus brumalis]
MLTNEPLKYIAALATEVMELHLADLEYEKEEAKRTNTPIPLETQIKQDKGLSVMHRPEEVTEWLKVLWCNTAKSPLIKDDVAYAEK